MNIVSLFSGAGGLDLGLIQAGHRIIWANDIDADSCETYKKNIGDHIVCCDISAINIDSIPDCDVVIGGFPCQGFSMANMLRDVSDERNRLYFNFYEIVNKKKPYYFIAENVRGILSLDKGNAIKKIIDDFSNAGYRVEYKLINMADFGVPQTRIRVIIVGTRKDLPIEMNFQFPQPTHDKKSWVSISTALHDIPEPLDTNDNLKNHVFSKYKVTNRNFTGHRETNPDKPSPTILARGNGKGGVCAIQHPKNHRRMSVRESALIQTFPLDFDFFGSMSSMYRQVGNAVPVLFGLRLGEQLKKLESKKNMKVVSLFSGAGGLDLGFIQANHTIIWANDNFPDAVKTYRKNIGNHIICEDISKISSSEIPDHDILIGGFPCQGFSIANSNRKESDERNKLYLELLRVLTDKQPKFFLAENVKGILSLMKGAVFEMIISDFRNAGYNIKYKVLNAADFGVPQKRERVIILGVRNDIDFEITHPEPTHSEKPNLFDHKESWVSIGEALKDIPEPEELHNLVNHTYSKFKLKFNGYLGNRAIDPTKPAPTVTARGDDKGGVVILHHPKNHRRMSVRELALTQSFPIDFIFEGNNSSAYRQIGNAVPPKMAYALASIFPLEM